MEHKGASIRGTIIRELIAHFSKEYLTAGKLNKENPDRTGFEPPWICPLNVLVTKIQMDKFTMEWLVPEYANTELVILQLHGGGYIGNMKNIYRNFAVAYSEAGNKCPVLTIDYRVAPEDPYPAALEDAYASYLWLIEQGYCSSQIVLVGDSAGGGLALGLCMYLKDQGISLPYGLIAMSPWTDQTNSGESYDTNYEKDPLFGKTRDSLLYNREYRRDTDPTLSYLSPLFGDYYGFPPMLLQVGSYEMLLSDSVEVAKKAKTQGVKVRLSIYEGMFHVFQMSMKLMPESKKAWNEIASFLKVLYGGKISRSSTKTTKQISED